MPDSLLNLVGDIYQASLHPEHWNQVLHKLGAMLGAKSGGLFLEDRRAGSRALLAHFGLPRLSLPAYRFGLAKYDYVFQLQLRQPAGQASQLVDHREVKDDHPLYYRFLLKPNDIGYVCAMVIVDDEAWHVGLGLHRSFGGAPFSAEDLHLLNVLYPHFKRALRIQWEFHRLRTQEQSLQTTLARMALGVIVLGPDRQVEYINPVAEVILAQHRGLELPNGSLRAHYPEEHTRLTEMIASLGEADPSDVGNRDLALGLHHPDREFPLTVMLTTLNDASDATTPGGARGSVALYLSAAESSVNIPAEALQAVYGMTTAEAKVAISLANGLSLQQISAQNGVGLETVRSQLKAVFGKMRVSKQQDVIRLLLSGAVNIEPAAQGKAGFGNPELG